MRREQKTIAAYSLGGALLVGGIDFLLQLQELKRQDKKLNWENYNLGRTVLWSGAGGLGGAIIGNIQHQKQIEKEKKESFNPEKYLRKILKESRLGQDSPQKQNALNIANQLIDALDERFSEKLKKRPTLSGSIAKNTALSTSFDADIFLEFMHSSYSSLKMMYNDVLTFLRQFEGYDMDITQQTRSIGITISIQKERYFFDIVPSRLVSDDDNEISANLFKNDNSFWSSNTSYSKTEATFQYTKRNTRLRRPDDVKVLFKKYRNINELDISSTILSQCIDIYYKKHSTGNLFSDFLSCLGFLADKMYNQSFIDLDNSNNDFFKKNKKRSRIKIANFIQEDIEEIQENSRYLKEIFQNN